MKRLIVATAVALSGTALADAGKPFEQLDLDRALPPIPGNVATHRSTPRERLPFEQTQFDRGELAYPEPVRLVQLGDAPYKSDEVESESPWAKDPHFIAPPL